MIANNDIHLMVISPYWGGVQDAGETEKAIFMYGNCTENGKMLTISRLTETEIMAYVFGKLTENGKK